MARKLLLKAFLKDKADDYKIEVGSRTGYFFYGTKAEFMQFCKAGKGSDMKPLPLNRHIKEKYKSVLEPDYTILLITGDGVGSYSYPGDSGERKRY